MITVILFMCILPAVFIKILVKLNINYIKDLYGDEINKKSKIRGIDLCLYIPILNFIILIGIIWFLVSDENEIKEEIKKRYR